MSDFMPKKPTKEEFEKYWREHPLVAQEGTTFQRFIDDWWQKEIEPLFAGAEVYHGKPCEFDDSPLLWRQGDGPADCTHEFLVIAKPKPKTDSEKLKAILDAYDSSPEWIAGKPKDMHYKLVEAIEQARKA